jgi:two-component system, OmpR family, KDP operon response regulator KdpE
MDIGRPRGDAGGRILVIEDDTVLRQAVESAVGAAGFDVTAVGDGRSGSEALGAQRYDVIVLDLGLPFVDGWQILSTLDSRDAPSVVIISARGEERDKVRALDMGADDYIAKPFSADELVARLRAVLRRARPLVEPPRVVQRGEIVIDLGKRTVFRGGDEVRLTPTEYLLLAELARNEGEVLDHRTLLRRVWGPSYGSEMSYLRAFIHRLRSKLEADPAHPRVVMTVGRQGYRFGPAADVEGA